jgi:hemoglobin-like flavoprotein
MDEKVAARFDESLRRCDSDPRFLDIFYERFLASSPDVQEKFANTDFSRQKRLLRASFYLILLASEDETHGPENYLKHLTVSHGASGLEIGAHFYDLWLDSLLATVKQCDPEYSSEVEAAWEEVMGVGIEYMLKHYHPPNPPVMPSFDSA